MITTAEERREMLDDLWRQVREESPSDQRDRCQRIVACFEMARNGAPIQAQIRLRRLSKEAKMVAHGEGAALCYQIMPIVEEMIAAQSE